MNRFPLSLQQERRWVVARLEERDGRTTKVPYQASDPSRRASSTDPTTWTDFATARAAVAAQHGLLLGFMLGDGFVGVDIDHCRNPETGVIDPPALEIIELLNAYTETSVSGTGVHVICLGSLPPGGRRKGPVEMYDNARFFVMTGDQIGDAEIEDRTSRLADLHSRVFGAPVNARPADTAPAQSVAGIPDDELLRRISASGQGAKFDHYGQVIPVSTEEMTRRPTLRSAPFSRSGRSTITIESIGCSAGADSFAGSGIGRTTATERSVAHARQRTPTIRRRPGRLSRTTCRSAST